jgi:putative transposase
VPGGLYHAVLRGNHRQSIFDNSGDYHRFEDILARALDRYDAELFAYCWMKNHVHLAIRIAEAPLGAVMGIVASRYARAKQRHLETTGHLFERRYRARLVAADRYLLALVRYIHLNPVRAQLVTDPRDYRWSSHRAYLGALYPQWLRPETVLRALGPSADAARRAYRRLMNAAPDDTERDAIAATARPGRRRNAEMDTSVRACVPIEPRIPRSLDAIVAAVAIEYGVAVHDLLSRRRHAALVEARREIARQALREGVANLSQVARHLDRAPSTLSGSLLGQP